MKREDFQDIWEKIVNKGFTDYENLTEPEMVWFLVEPIIIDGLIDHYLNNGAKNNNDLLKSLTILNMEPVRTLFIEANALFKNGIPSDIDERNDEIVNWLENKTNKFEELDDKFWKYSEELESRLYDYLIKSSLWV